MQELHTLTLKSASGPVLLEVVRTGRKYRVTKFEAINRPELYVAFAAENPGFENLDGKSDIAQCFNLSNKVKYDSVIIGTQEMRANSWEELAYALTTVKLRLYNPEEI